MRAPRWKGKAREEDLVRVGGEIPLAETIMADVSGGEWGRWPGGRGRESVTCGRVGGRPRAPCRPIGDQHTFQSETYADLADADNEEATRGDSKRDGRE